MLNENIFLFISMKESPRFVLMILYSLTSFWSKNGKTVQNQVQKSFSYKNIADVLVTAEKMYIGILSLILLFLHQLIKEVNF